MKGLILESASHGFQKQKFGMQIHNMLIRNSQCLTLTEKGVSTTLLNCLLDTIACTSSRHFKLSVQNRNPDPSPTPDLLCLQCSLSQLMARPPFPLLYWVILDIFLTSGQPLWLQLWNNSRIQPLLTISATNILIQGTIISYYLGYCKCLLTGLLVPALFCCGQESAAMVISLKINLIMSVLSWEFPMSLYFS